MRRALSNGEKLPHVDLQKQCSRQREQPVKVPRGMKGMSPEVRESALLAVVHGQGEECWDLKRQAGSEQGRLCGTQKECVCC